MSDIYCHFMPYNAETGHPVDTKRVKRSEKTKPGRLGPQEELDLISKAQANDQSAKDRLTQAFQELVKKTARGIASKYSKSNVSYTLSEDDLISEGTIGLLEAIRRFDLSSGHRLSTFASKYIKGYISNAIRKESKVKKGIRPAKEEEEEEDTIEDKRPPKEDQILLGKGRLIENPSPVSGQDASPRLPKIAPDWTPSQWEREVEERLTKLLNTLTSWEAKGKMHLLRPERVKIKGTADEVFEFCIYGHLLYKARTWTQNYDPMFWLKELKGKAQTNRKEKAKEAAWKECQESNKLLDAMEPKDFIHRILKKWVKHGADLRLIQRAYLELVEEKAGHIGADRSLWRGNPKKLLTSAQKYYQRNKDRWNDETKRRFEGEISDLETQVQEYRQPPPGRKGLRPDHALNRFILTIGKHLREKTGSPHTTELTDLLERLGFSRSSPNREPERRGVKTSQRRKREERNPRPYLGFPIN